MPRKPRKKSTGEPVAVADTLEELVEKHGLKPASQALVQLPDPRLEAEPPEREVVTSPDRDPVRRKKPDTHAAAVLAKRPAFAPIPAGFMNVSRYESAGIRVNKTIDYQTAALQFSEDRPLSRSTEYDLMELVQSAGFQYKPTTRQWERPAPEAMTPGENIIEAGQIAKEIARARGVERGR